MACSFISYFFAKNVVGTHWNCFNGADLLSTHSGNTSKYPCVSTACFH